MVTRVGLAGGGCVTGRFRSEGGGSRKLLRSLLDIAQLCGESSRDSFRFPFIVAVKAAPSTPLTDYADTEFWLYMMTL